MQPRLFLGGSGCLQFILLFITNLWCWSNRKWIKLLQFGNARDETTASARGLVTCCLAAFKVYHIYVIMIPITFLPRNVVVGGRWAAQPAADLLSRLSLLSLVAIASHAVLLTLHLLTSLDRLFTASYDRGCSIFLLSILLFLFTLIW